MSSDTVIRVESLSKQYRLGLVGTGTLSHDLNRWWCRVRGKPDPTLKVTKSNDRSHRGHSEYVWALRDINFEVKRGEVLGIIGRNGAGKSTLLKILSRVTAPTEGRIKIKGRLAALLEVGTGFHPELTGRENIYLNGAILGMTKSEITRKLDEIIEFSGCERYIDTPVKRYSSGMMVRLGFAVAAHLEPEILIVDEVLAVGDAEFQKKCLGKMQDVAAGGRTVLFVSHNMAAVNALTKRSLLMETGGVTMDADTDLVISRYTASSGVDDVLGALRPVDSINCERRLVADDRATMVALGLQPGESAAMPSGGNLHLALVIETKCPLRGLTIGYTVRHASAGPVLNGYTPPFSVSEPGRVLLHLDIDRLPLAPGDYHLCLSINHGGLVEAKRTFDVLLGAGAFRVESRLLDGGALPGWLPAWGWVVHRESRVRMSSAASDQ